MQIRSPQKNKEAEYLAIVKLMVLPMVVTVFEANIVTILTMMALWLVWQPSEQSQPAKQTWRPNIESYTPWLNDDPDNLTTDEIKQVIRDECGVNDLSPPVIQPPVSVVGSLVKGLMIIGITMADIKSISCVLVMNLTWLLLQRTYHYYFDFKSFVDTGYSQYQYRNVFTTKNVFSFYRLMLMIYISTIAFSEYKIHIAIFLAVLYPIMLIGGYMYLYGERFYAGMNPPVQSTEIRRWVPDKVPEFGAGLVRGDMDFERMDTKIKWFGSEPEMYGVPVFREAHR